MARNPVAPAEYVRYYRAILQKIAEGYEHPRSIAGMALNWTLHHDGCSILSKEWADCDCGASDE